MTDIVCFPEGGARKDNEKCRACEIQHGKLLALEEEAMTLRAVIADQAIERWRASVYEMTG